MAQAPNKVEQEKQLGEQHEQQPKGGQRAQVLQLGPCLLRKLRIAVDAALVPGGAGDEQRDEHYVESYDRAPEVNLTQAFVEHPPEHLRIPEREPGEGPDNGDGDKCVVEVRDDEIRIVQI